MSDNIYDFLLRKRNVKLLLIRFLLYQRIFEFCFLLLTPNSVLYYTVTPNAASACKNCRKSQTRNTARAMCAPQNHPNYPSYHLQNQEGWSSETHFFEMEPGPTASSYPKWPAGTPRGARAPPTEQFRAAAHLAENGSVSVLPTSNAHISLKSAFRDPRFSIEAESCLDLANGAKKNFRIFFGKNRNFLVFLVSCCFLIWKMNEKFSEFLNCLRRFPVSWPPLSLWSLIWKMCRSKYIRIFSSI